jgi:SAM-dependent methyltransferase/thiol-disulfide isomerase/thioredoxin
MAFDGAYIDWNQKRIKAFVEHYGHQFFFKKKVLDLGCGHGDISGVLHRLGADVTAVDARQEHLKIIDKKYNGVKIVKADLDQPWPFFGKTFDLTLDLALICHLQDFEKHLQAVCDCTNFLILETAVLDSDNPYACIVNPDSKGIYDKSYNGFITQVSAANIERVLTENGMLFERIDKAKFNSGPYTYDWSSHDDNTFDFNKRRIWFCVKKGESQIVNNTTNTLPHVSSGNFSPHLLDSRVPISYKQLMTTSSPSISTHYQSVATSTPNNISLSNNNFTYRLSVCAYCKDETPYLEEWLNFHRCVGVEHFYIYDNLSKIPVTETLEKYINAGFVDVIDFPGPGRQLPAHQHYIDNFKTQSEWCAFIDIDEFIVPKSTDNIKNILKDYQRYGALCVPWVKFSSNGHLQKPFGLVMENYTLSMIDTVVKVIGHMPHIIKAGGNIINAHMFTYQNGFYAVDEQHKRVILDHARTTNNKIQINHYLFRSKQEFEEKLKKSQICIADGETTTATARSINELHEANANYKRTDKSIFRFIEKTKKLYL